MDDDKQPRLLTVKEFADISRKHPRTVYRLIDEGRLPGVYRIGGSIRLAPPKPQKSSND